MSDLESSLISFVASDPFSAMFVIQSCQFWTWQRGDKKREDGERGSGDYSSETIILNISVKEGQLFEWGLLIEGRLFFGEIG